MPHPRRAITRDIRTRRPKRTTREADEQAALGWPEDTVCVSVGILTVSDVLKTLIRIIDEGVISKPGRWGAEA